MRTARRCSTRPASMPEHEDPLVAARRRQLGRRAATAHAGARRHRPLHRPAALRVDLEPARQHRRAHRRAASSTTRRRCAVQPDPNTTSRPTSPARRGELRAERDRPRLQVPAGLAHQLRASITGCPAASTGTAEFIYNKDVNGIYYINANLPAAQSSFTGVDQAALAGRVRRRNGPCVIESTTPGNQSPARS